MMTDDEYRRKARALARETQMKPASAERIERALLRAMMSRDSDRVRWRSWLSMAAAIVLTVGALLVWQTNRSALTPETTVKPAEGDPRVSATPIVENTTKQAPVVTTRALTTHPVRRHKRITPRPNLINPTGFVELPWTRGLPAFESGEILRLEVPAAALPAYGIDISAGADRPVEADILIGQDGLARAIRLVTNSVRSVQ